MVGRTARAGKAGVSVSLAGEKERKLVKEIVKRAKNPVKARVIPPEILDKYRTKVEQLDPQIESILQEEYAERMLAKAENQHNRMEKRLQGPGERERPWFQTPQERRAEKERLTLAPGAPKPKVVKKPNPDGKPETPDNKKQNDKKSKKKGFKKLNPEERAEAELEKMAQLQVRIAKRSKRQKRIQTVYDDGGAGAARAGQKRKATSSFTRDLTDTSKKGAKRMRYDANVRQKEIKVGKSFTSKKGAKNSKAPMGKKGVRAPKGKAFGKPQKSKKSKF